MTDNWKQIVGFQKEDYLTEHSIRRLAGLANSLIAECSGITLGKQEATNEIHIILRKDKQK